MLSNWIVFLTLLGASVGVLALAFVICEWLGDYIAKRRETLSGVDDGRWL